MGGVIIFLAHAYIKGLGSDSERLVSRFASAVFFTFLIHRSKR